MPPRTPLPFSEDFKDKNEYVDSLLDFATSSRLFQTLCGGVHILDFFTGELSLYDAVLPEEWRLWLMSCDSMSLLDFLMRDDLENSKAERQPPPSLVQYVKDIRKHSLLRNFSPPKLKQSTLPRHVAVGMVPKKIHEVTHFADYVDRLAEDIATHSSQNITHFVDFGSGQNYLGRALASPPYNKHIIAVESKELNINGAKTMDVLARVAEKEVVLRNKKLYREKMDDMTPSELLNEKARRRVAKPKKPLIPTENVADMRPRRDLNSTYTPVEGQGSIQYVEHVVENGDLSSVVSQIGEAETASSPSSSMSDIRVVSVVDTTSQDKDDNAHRSAQPVSAIVDPRLMAISIHSCGNLSHHGIRSLLLNPSVHAIAIVGCCYNLLTERLGPPTYKLPLMRPNLQPINARVARESAACDPHGFPMSNRVSNHKVDGVRLNITARMMAVQAPQNWTEKESDSFFTRHFFRSLLQKVFLDRGVVGRPGKSPESGDTEEPLLKNEGTDPVIIGSLRKGCYGSFTSYVRGAIEKLTSNSDRGNQIAEKMGDMTDAEIEWYSQQYEPRKRELSIMWSLMAFSAGVVESLIVVDRWLYLKEHPDVVKDCWVEAVFDYEQSPRNLVVVGVKN